MTPTRRARLGVVVPAHNEQALLGACLGALGAAARDADRVAEVRVLVVLDACRDASAGIASAAGVETLPAFERNVGRARALGAARLLEWSDWIATTDADSRVPPGWLLAQHQALSAGWDAMLGTVLVDDPADRHRCATDRTDCHLSDRAIADRHEHRYRRCAGHPHVHGANLAVRPEAYRRAGGFPDLPTGEDVALAAALAPGSAVLRTPAQPVWTSARRHARAPAGFAEHLAHLTDTARPAPNSPPAQSGPPAQSTPPAPPDNSPNGMNWSLTVHGA